MSLSHATPQSPSPSETRTFGYMLAGGSLIAGSIWTGLIHLFTGEWNVTVLFYFLAIGGSLSLLCIALPRQLRPFHRGWLRITRFLETAITCLLLGIFYYLILTPVALCLRLLGHRPFIKRGNIESKSYWEPVERAPTIERYYRQY